MKDDDSAQSGTAVKSAERVLDLFELLGRWDREMSHTEIAAALSIPKSSLTLLLRTLVARGYIDFTARSKGYRLGHGFSVLARQSGRVFDLIACVEPILAKVSAAVGESAALNQLKGQQAEVTATILGPHRLVSHMRLGDLSPLYATSGGKVILAYLPEDQQKEYLANVRLERITDKTIKSVAALKREIETIRRDGVAYSFEEFTPGIIGIARAILSRTHHPVGSINIAMPAVRVNEKALKHVNEVLQQAIKDISRQITHADIPETL